MLQTLELFPLDLMLLVDKKKGVGNNVTILLGVQNTMLVFNALHKFQIKRKAVSVIDFWTSHDERIADSQSPPWIKLAFSLLYV